MIRVNASTIERMRRYATMVAARKDEVYMSDDKRLSALLDVVLDFYLLKELKPFEYQPEPQPELSFQ